MEEHVPLSHDFFFFENPCIKVDAHPHSPSRNLRMNSPPIQNIPQNIQIFVRIVKVPGHIILLDQVDIEKFLDFILCQVLLKIVLFY